MRRWVSMLAVVAALIATFFALAAIGAGQVARHARVLGVLQPVVESLRAAGWGAMLWMLDHGSAVGTLVSVAACGVAVMGWRRGGRRAAPLWLLAAAIVLVTWGQVLLIWDRTAAGTASYVSALLCAFALGMWCPLASLPGFPRLPLPAGTGESRAADPSAPAWTLPWRWECAVVFLLGVAALLTRLYALGELPAGFDLEMTGFMILSRTPYGFVQYLRTGLLSNNNGVLHLLTQMGLYPLFGTTFYTVRLAAVFWGVAAVPLFYWLVRRMAGVGPAILAGLFFVAAPEQLFWSRTENAFFAPATILALVTAHLGVWMTERLSPWAVLAAALWMPAARYFYTPSMVMFLYPLVLAAHALLFVRGAWRKAWYVVPVLAGGFALWLFSLTLLYAYFDNWQHWRFVDPANVYGGAVWEKQGQFKGVALTELIRLQAVSIAENLRLAIENMTYSGGVGSHWYDRAQPASHPTAVNMGVTGLFALGFAYLLGQLSDRRACALLALVGLGLLPGVLSDEPAPRRIILIYPAFHGIAAITVAMIVRLVRDRAGPALARRTASLLSIPVAVIIVTSLASHFSLRMAPIHWNAAVEFAQPLFDTSDIIFHRLSNGPRLALQLVNLDRLLQLGAPAFQAVDEDDWLDVALHPRCEAAMRDYDLLPVPPSRRQALRAACRANRISFLIEALPRNRPQIDFLRGVYPSAIVRDTAGIADTERLVSVTMDRAAVAAVHAPWLITGPRADRAASVGTSVLEGVTLAEPPAERAPHASGEELIVRGALLVDRDGWYRFALQPPCPAASLTIPPERPPQPGPAPMLAGVHPFELRLARADACPLPLRVLLQSAPGAPPTVVAPSRLLSPAVADVPEARASTIVDYPGYADARTLAAFPARAVDFDIDAAGRSTVLVQKQGAWYAEVFDRAGRHEAEWRLDVERGDIRTMVVSNDGTLVVLTGQTVILYDRAGQRIGSWTSRWATWESELARWNDLILMNLRNTHSIAAFSRDGILQSEFRRFNGGPGGFTNPISLTIGHDGQMLVLQEDGQALLFQLPADAFAPAFVRAFRLDLGPHGCTFDGPDRIVVPAPTGAHAYDLFGRRMMAASAARDLSAKGLGAWPLFQSAADRLYALDPMRNRLVSMARAGQG